MKAYYCISNHDREFLYIPFVLFSHCSARQLKPIHIFDVQSLSKLTLLSKECKIKRERLEDKGWEISETEIPDRMVRKFTDFCFVGKSKRRLRSRADRIFYYAQDSVECSDEECYCDGRLHEERTYHDKYDEIYDEEDYKDDWWLSGEEPPEFSD